MKAGRKDGAITICLQKFLWGHKKNFIHSRVKHEQSVFFTSSLCSLIWYSLNLLWKQSDCAKHHTTLLTGQLKKTNKVQG